MSSKHFAYIKGPQLTWARERRGWSHDQLAEKLPNTKAQHITEWEQGSSFPTFNKAIKIATVLHIPLGYLFAETPPTEIPPLPDLRTRPGETPADISTNFLDLLYSVKRKHEWFRTYKVEQGSEPLSFVSSFKINDDAEAVAANMRQIIGIGDADIRRESASWQDYLSKLVKRAERIGIIVLRSGVVENNNTRPLSIEEFQGFAIADLYAPLVFINARDFVASRIFTFAHEIAHIWIGASGISCVEEEPKRIQDQSRIEIFCNQIAAEALVPKYEFLKRWRLNDFRQVQGLSSSFRVSARVIVRRARELGLIDWDGFRRLWEQALLNEKPEPKKSKGGNFYNTEDARHSPTFMDAVFSDVKAGDTSYREGARLLDVKVPTFERLMEGTPD